MLYAKNIYLAEDDIDDVDFFNEALQEISTGYTLTVLSNGEELVQAVNTSETLPDIIFIDVNMPKMDGIQALVSLNNEGRIKNIPIIIYSTSSNEDHIIKAYNNGACHYFTKPNNFDILTNKIRDFLSVNWSETKIPVPFEKFAI